MSKEQFSITVPVEFLNILKWGCGKDGIGTKEILNAGEWNGKSITGTDGKKLITYNLTDAQIAELSHLEVGNYQLVGDFRDSVEMETDCECDECYGRYYMHHQRTFNLTSFDKEVWTGDGFYLKRIHGCFPNWEEKIPKKENCDFSVSINPDFLEEIKKAILGTGNKDEGLILHFNTKDHLATVFIECQNKKTHLAMVGPMRFTIKDGGRMGE